MKRLLHSVGFVLGLVATAAFVWYAARMLGTQDFSRFGSARGIAAVAVAACCYASIIPTSAWAWAELLKGFGEPRARKRTLLGILSISQFAKYIPGNVGAHLGRAGMAIARGIGTRAVVLSLLTETVLAAAAALVVGMIGIAFSDIGTRLLTQGPLRSGLLAALGVLAATTVATIIIRMAPAPIRSWFATQHAWPGLLQAFAAYLLNYAAIGIGIWLMATLMLPQRQHEIGLLAASFSVAWVAGFFAPGAPAGIGIREGLMLLVLTSAYSTPDALLLVVGVRVATVLADVAIFLTGSLVALHARRRATS